MAEEGVQTGRLMGPSETGSEVLKVSWDGLQGGFRAAFHIDVLKRWQEEATLSIHDSAFSHKTSVRTSHLKWGTIHELRIWKDAFKIKVLKYCNGLYKSCLFKHDETGQMSDLAAIVEEKHQLFPICTFIVTFCDLLHSDLAGFLLLAEADQPNTLYLKRKSWMNQLALFKDSLSFVSWKYKKQWVFLTNKPKKIYECYCKTMTISIVFFISHNYFTHVF